MVNNRKQCLMPQDEIPDGHICVNLKPSDRVVLKYLDKLTLDSDGETCTVSIPKIASACDISERQVQISTKRLINAGLLQRIGYDFSNPDREKRGTIYKVLASEFRVKHPAQGAVGKKSIKFILFWSDE